MTRGLGERLLIAVTIALALSGCTPEASPEITGAPTTTTTTEPPTVPPPISRPLDASRYATKESICGLLSAEQSAELGFPDGDPGATSSGQLFSCGRMVSSELDQPHVMYNLWTNRNVLEERYPPEPTEYDFMTLSILGQPAARMRSSHTGAPRQCLLVLGLAEKQGVEIQAFDNAGKACDLVVAVAEQIVRNLGG